jgi:hypothetical protein
MKKKNPAAVALGRLGGVARAKSLTAKGREESARKAGKARLSTMTTKQRSAVAKKAAAARWKKKGDE